MPLDLTMNIPAQQAGRVRERLEEVAYDVGVTARHIYLDQLRLMVQDFMSSGMPLPAKAPEGREAINRDLNKLFVGIDQQAVLNFFEEDFGSGELPSSVVFNFDGNEARMRGFWERHRRKTGRKQGRVRYMGKIVATVGEWKFVNKMYVPMRALRRFRKSLYEDVATLKAGWVIAGQQLAAAVSGNIRIPAWVMKQARKMGRVSIATMKKNGDGYISATNSVPYADAKYNKTGLMLPFLRKRQKDIFGHLDKRIPRLIKQFNKG